MSSIYENTVDTLGFYKFNKDPWNTNSISNPPINLDFKGLKSADLHVTGLFATSNFNPEIIKTKYKSRPSAIILPESSCIYADLPNSLSNSTFSTVIGSYLDDMTFEFWVYPKKGTNDRNPNSTYNGLINYRSVTAPYGTEIDNSYASSYINNQYCESTFSNPFLFTYNYNTGNYTWGQRNISLNSSSKKIYCAYISFNLGYCCYRKGFNINAYLNWQNQNREYLGSSYSNVKFIGNCPPNRWYHVAITLHNTENSAQLCLFINGEAANFNGTDVSNVISNMNGNQQQVSYAKFSTTNAYISIGNRAIWSDTSIWNNYFYTAYSFEPVDMHPGFQDIIIDDLRISKGILYTDSFVPPGIIGKQILIYDDYAYYVDPDTEDLIKLSFSKWDEIDTATKALLLDRVGYDFTPTVEQIKIIQTDPAKPVKYENYQLDTVKPNIYIDKIDKSRTEIVYPNTFISDYSSMNDYVVNIEANGITDLTANIRLAVTRDLQTYYTYNLTNNEWVPLTNKEDVLTDGIRIESLKDIPRTGWVSFGLDKFAFSIALYTSDEETVECRLNDIVLTLNMNGKWVKSNIETQSKYKYIGPTLLRVSFLEDGKYKVNYNDRGGE